MNIHVVALIETGYYCIDPADVEYIAQIHGVYFYDKEQQTHACEMTPSYYLVYLYDLVVLTEAGEALDEDEKDRLYQAYEYNGGENKYVHCYAIDELPDDRRYIFGDSEAHETVEYDDQIEALREHFCANCPL